MEEIKKLLEMISRIENIQDFIYNDKRVLKIQSMCDYLQTFLDKHGSFEKLVKLLHIIDEQSYILKDDYTAEEAAKYLGVSVDCNLKVYHP